MIFDSVEQHSPRQIEHIRLLIQRYKELPRKVQIWLMVQLVQHGWPEAERWIMQFRDQLQPGDAHDFLSKLIAQTYVVQEIPNWDEVRKDPKVITPFYQLNNYLYIPGLQHRNKLVILFSTMYNNFYLSNAMMGMLLKSWGVSVLLLKDATRFQYLNGVQGLGSNLFEVAQGVSQMINQHQIDEVYILGFSSGGYGSLLLSTQLNCNAYLGFSVHTHLADRTRFPLGKFLTQEVLDKVSPRSLLNLRELIDKQSHSPKRTIVYGEAASGDEIQAKNLQGCKNLDLLAIPNCGHVTVAEAIEQKTFLPMLRQLIFSERQ